MKSEPVLLASRQILFTTLKLICSQSASSSRLQREKFRLAAARRGGWFPKRSLGHGSARQSRYGKWPFGGCGYEMQDIHGYSALANVESKFPALFCFQFFPQCLLAGSLFISVVFCTLITRVKVSGLYRMFFGYDWIGYCMSTLKTYCGLCLIPTGAFTVNSTYLNFRLWSTWETVYSVLRSKMPK